MPLDLFPGRPDRQRPGRQVVLAGQVGGVRRRPRADRPAEVAEPPVARLVVRDAATSRPPPGRAFRSARSGTATGWGFDDGARALPGGIPDNKIVRRASTRPMSATRRTRSPSSAGCWPNAMAPGRPPTARPGQNWSATFGNRFGKLGIVASVDAVLQGAVRRRGSHASTASPEAGGSVDWRPSATTRCSTAPRRPSSASSATSPTSSRRTTACRSRTSTRTAAATKDDSSKAPTPTTHCDYRELPAAVHRRGAAVERRRRRALLPGTVQQPVRLARQLRARHPRRTGPARDALRARRSTAAHGDAVRSCSPTSRRAASGCSTARRRHAGRQRQLEHASTRRRAPDAVQVRCAATWTAPATSSRAGSASSRSRRTKDGRDLLFNNPLHARGALHPAQHRHGVPIQRGDAADRRLRRRPDHDLRLRHGGHRLSRSHTRLIAGARVERFDQAVNTFDPFGLFVARRCTADEQEHGHLPRRELRAGAAARTSNLRLSYSTTVNRPEFRELAEFEFTDVVGNRAVRQPGAQARADPERRRPLGDVRGRPGRRRRQRLLQVLRQADRARRPRGGASRSRPSRTPTMRATSASSSRPATSIADHFFVNANYTFVDSKITLLPEQLTRADLARAAAGRPVEEPVQRDGSKCTLEASRPAALQLLRRPHLGRRRQRGARTSSSRARHARPRVVAARRRPQLRLNAREPDRQPTTASPRATQRPAALQAGPHRRRCRSASASF